MTKLYTIGYEGRELDEFIGELKAHQIDRVIDVRELPLSRRAGFSKTPLHDALEALDVEYVHLKIAGNPYRKDPGDVLAKYKRYLADTTPAVTAVVDAARGHRAALLCYERAPADCHRSILAKRVARRLRVKPLDL